MSCVSQISTKTIKPINKKITYPVLARSVSHAAKHSTYVALFTSEIVGMIIHDPSGVHGMGYYSSNWVPVSDATAWKILLPTEVVELSNVE